MQFKPGISIAKGHFQLHRHQERSFTHPVAPFGASPKKTSSGLIVKGAFGGGKMAAQYLGLSAI
jgi:hypothetical protein